MVAQFSGLLPNAGKFLASPHARDDVEQRPPLRTPACNQSFATHASGGMGTVYMTVFQKFSKQYSNSIYTVFKTVIENVDMFRTVLKNI